MHNAYGTFGSVDTLTSGSTRAKNIYTKITFFDFHFGLFNFWEHSNRSCGSMNTASFFCFWNTLYAVYTHFIFHISVHTVTADGENNFFVSANTDLVFVDESSFPSFAIRIFHVHAHEVSC